MEQSEAQRWMDAWHALLLPGSEATSELQRQYLGAMRRLASGVAVVTAVRDGQACGIAATSVTSLTVHPPALLLCVNQATQLHGALFEGAPFCVNLLTAAQREVSIAFGGALRGPARFEKGRWENDRNGVPRLLDSDACVSCRVHDLIAYGTHSIVIGSVEDVLLSTPMKPLIYHDGGYQ